MTREILYNCDFDTTRIVKLFIASQDIDENVIIFPVTYNTVAGSDDSVIMIQSWSPTNVVRIGNQNIQFHEIYYFNDNIQFEEKMVRDNRGRYYKKTLTFEIPGISRMQTDELEALGLYGQFNIPYMEILAILIDENGNKLISGYDVPFRIRKIDKSIDNEKNSYIMTFESYGHSRSRTVGMTLPDVSPTPTITPTISVSSSITPSVSVSPFLTPTPSISVSQFLTPTPSITPSCIRPTDKYKELYLYYSGATGNFTGSLSEACNALQYWAQTGFHIEIYEKHNVLIFNENPDFIRDSCSGFYEDTFVYSGHNTTDCILMDEGYYIYRCSIFSMGETYYFGYIFHIDSNGILDNYNAQTQCPQPTPSISVTPSVTSTPNISVTPFLTPTINPTLTPSISITSSVTPTISLTPTITITPTITPSISRSITPTMTPSTTPILQLELIYQNLGNVQSGNYYGIPSIYVSWDNGSITGQTSAYTINGSSRIGVVNVATPTLPSALWNTNVTFTITRTICGSSPVYNTTRRALIGYSDSYFEDLNQTGLNESVGSCPAGTTHSYVFTPFTLSSSERNVRIMWADLSEI